MAEAAQVGLGGCCCAVCLVLLILCLCSIKGLHATKFAMTKNSMTGRINLGSTYHGGRNFIGFWNDYLEFPATLQSLEWLASHPVDMEHTKDLTPMIMRTSDGLMVQLGITVQYKIVQDKIPEMYQDFKDSYENFFISNIRSGFQDILARHPSDDLWVHRHRLNMEFQRECQTICADPTKIRGYIQCWGVQLTGANIDDQIEAKIIQRQVQVQEQQYYAVKRQAALIRTGTDVMKADYDKNITIARANATGSAFSIRNSAMADAAYNFSAAKAQALTTIHNTVLDGTTPLEHIDVIRYQERTSLIEKRQANLVYGDFQEVRISAHGDPLDAVAQPSGRRLSDGVAEPKPLASVDSIPEDRFKLGYDVPDPIEAKYHGEL